MSRMYSFSEALACLASGYKVARVGWNGKDQWVMRFDSEGADIEGYPVAPCLALKNAQDVVQLGWAPSQGDLFATDWVLVGQGKTDRAETPAAGNGPTGWNLDRADIEPKDPGELTFGQKAVGLTFNPSNDPVVHRCKQGFADLIDMMHALRMADTGGKGRHASIAITLLEDAQMRAVKALTWRD